MCVEYFCCIYFYTNLVCEFLTLCGGNTISLSFTYYDLSCYDCCDFVIMRGELLPHLPFYPTLSLLLSPITAPSRRGQLNLLLQTQHRIHNMEASPYMNDHHIMCINYLLDCGHLERSVKAVLTDP